MRNTATSSAVDFHYLVRSAWQDEDEKNITVHDLSDFCTYFPVLDVAVWTYHHSHHYGIIMYSKRPSGKIYPIFAAPEPMTDCEARRLW